MQLPESQANFTSFQMLCDRSGFFACKVRQLVRVACGSPTPSVTRLRGATRETRMTDYCGLGPKLEYLSALRFSRRLHADNTQGIFGEDTQLCYLDRTPTEAGVWLWLIVFCILRFFGFPKKRKDE